MALTALEIKHAKVGMHADGNGLYLRVQATGAKSWIFRYQLNGKRREMGIGTLTDKSAVEVRADVADLTKLVRQKIDPIDERQRKALEETKAAQRAKVAAVTFSMVAAEYIESHRSGWKNAKHASQWESTLATYADPVIGGTPVEGVSTEDVLRILQPIWTTKTETASRVRSRLELILAFAKAKKLRQGENPAQWRGHLDALLPKPLKVKQVRHQPALPYGKIAEFMKALRAVSGSGARALEFAILTAARSGEVRLAKKAEIDLDGQVWNVPAERMKAGRPHRVPLSSAAVAVVKALPQIDNNEYLFPSVQEGKAISDMTLTALIRRMNESTEKPKWIDPTTGSKVVPHGFRSTFRDWAAEATTFPSEMAEMALAHTVGSKVEAAYRRGDMFERRREMMEAWAQVCGAA